MVKTIKNVSRTLTLIVMAVMLVFFSACELFPGSSGGEDKVYTVTLNCNDGTLINDITEYTSGTAVKLPTPTKDHYVFEGWYEKSDFSGKKVESISKNATGNKEYFAKWSPEKYTVTLYIDRKEYSSEVTSYSYGSVTSLPTPSKEGYTFNGWYANGSLSGNKITSIPASEYGNKIYYASMVANKRKYTVILNKNGGTLKSNLTEYTEGVGATLPEITKDGFVFDGWYDNADFIGSEVTEISSTATGNKVFYAKFVPMGELVLTKFNGYEEGAFVEFNTVSGISSYTVAYKKKGTSSYMNIDSALIRENNGKVRADIVGIAAGEYTVKVNAGSKSTVKDITVSAYDRSGYAFFNRSAYATSTSASVGVGAYKDDGTPKSNAQIIYVTESTKNTVTAKLGSTNYTGIGNILTNIKNATNPVIIRIIGRVAAATWNEINYNTSGQYNQNNKITEDKIIGKNGQQLPTASNQLTQKYLIENGYNTLNTSEYDELLGLSTSSKATYKSGAYDSCWNDCSINSGAHDVTVEGIGTDAEIFQWGMTWKQASSIEVRNLTFTDYTEDACSFQGDTNHKSYDISQFGSYYLWVHNCTFNIGKNYWDICDEQDKKDGDGCVDLKLCYGVTLSSNHYKKTHKTGLVGASDNESYTANVTFHHNYYDRCQSRLPLARQANMHMYNNYYSGSTSSNMSLRANAYAFIENCYFENCKNTIELYDSTAYAKVWGCTFTGSNTTSSKTVIVADNVSSRNQTVTNTNNPFCPNFDTGTDYFYLNAYTATTAAQAKTDCMAKSGVHKN